MTKQAVQGYPRLADSDLLDDTKLRPHDYKIPIDQLKGIIYSAIETADRKSSREILNLPDEISDEVVHRVYESEGRQLFAYFRQYFGDPASTAHQCLNRHCSEVAREQFRNRTLQKQRMNSAWRYQYIAKDAARASGRFESVSDIGLKEADFNVVITLRDTVSKLAIYVSVKNRSNTMGGQDWPKAIEALENEARFDKNRDAYYLCVFGITIERGLRSMRRNQKTGMPYSVNTELWFSDFFWPFFSNYSYEDIVKAVLEILLAAPAPEPSKQLKIPQELLDSFEACCRESELLDEQGRFKDAFKLVELFCRKKPSAKSTKTSRKKSPKKTKSKA